jgi:hypothetical protein
MSSAENVRRTFRVSSGLPRGASAMVGHGGRPTWPMTPVPGVERLPKAAPPTGQHCRTRGPSSCNFPRRPGPDWSTPRGGSSTCRRVAERPSHRSSISSRASWRCSPTSGTSRRTQADRWPGRAVARRAPLARARSRRRRRFPHGPARRGAGPRTGAPPPRSGERNVRQVGGMALARWLRGAVWNRAGHSLGSASRGQR